jgi:hypothetical protein
MHNDPIIEELHRHRRELMERFNYDFGAFVQHLKEQEALSQTPVIPAPQAKAPPPNPSLQRTRFARR